METRLHLKPGQNGTKRLVQKYGDRLVCVRYRYDEVSGQRHKTVELIEENGALATRNQLRAALDAACRRYLSR